MCEHRWPAIRNMIAFRNVVRNSGVESFWDNGKNQIAFCRGTRGFIAFNNEPTELNVKLFTCMPSGDYCDIITGNKKNGECSGTTLTVDENGEAQIVVASNVGVLAIHIGVRRIVICFGDSEKLKRLYYFRKASQSHLKRCQSLELIRRRF